MPVPNNNGTIEYETALRAQRQAQFNELANRVAAGYDPNFNASAAAVPAAAAAPATVAASAAAAPGTTRVIHPPIAVGTAADGRPIVQRGGFLGTRNVPWAAATRHVGYDPYTGQVSVTTLTGEPSPYPHVLRGGPAPIGTYALPALAQLAPLTQFHPGNIQSAPAKLKQGGGGGGGGGRASSPPPSHPADPLIEDIARNGYRLRSGPAEYYKDSLHMNPEAEVENIMELSRLPNGGVAGTRDDGSRYMNQDAMSALLYGGIDPTTGEAIPPSVTGPAGTYENGALHANIASMAGAVDAGSQYPQTTMDASSVPNIAESVTRGATAGATLGGTASDVGSTALPFSSGTARKAPPATAAEPLETRQAEETAARKYREQLELLEQMAKTANLPYGGNRGNANASWYNMSRSQIGTLRDIFVKDKNFRDRYIQQYGNRAYKDMLNLLSRIERWQSGDYAQF